MKYEITGKPFPVVIFQLDRGEYIYCEAGGMSWMNDAMTMDTQAGGIGKAFGRAFSGENMFVNKYQSERDGGEIAISSSFLGSIQKIELQRGDSIILQKGAILAYTEGIDRKVFFKSPMKGLFGGEGFIMQEVFGEGLLFMEVDGETREYDLAPGEKMILDTGHLLLMDKTCTMDIKSVGGVKNTLFGGEGLFNTTITGPGKVVIQTSPINKLASSLRPFFPAGS
ncbi:MAG: TIGR00266 family protein [Neofamilia sp.]